MMKSKAILSFFLAVLAGLVLAVSVGAKGPADMIVVEGPGLPAPVEITDPTILNRFDPWGGQFIGPGGPLAESPIVGEPYQVQFYLRNNRGELVLRYVFYYYINPTGGRGYTYLPGGDDPYYITNAGTISRGSPDGQWNNVNPVWDKVIHDLLEEHGTPMAGNGELPSPSIQWLAIGIVMVTLAGAALIIRFRTKTLRPFKGAPFAH